MLFKINTLSIRITVYEFVAQVVYSLAKLAYSLHKNVILLRLRYHIQTIFLVQQIPAVLYFLMTVLLRIFAPMALYNAIKQ